MRDVARGGKRGSHRYCIQTEELFEIVHASDSTRVDIFLVGRRRIYSSQLKKDQQNVQVSASKLSNYLDFFLGP